LIFPDKGELDGEWCSERMLWSLLGELEARDAAYLALDAIRYGRARWLIHLGDKQGLSGALLLGEKRDGGLYIEEEIEIARSAGERLLDTLAAVETARRLKALLQERIAQIRLMEGVGGRILHDEVLPQLHAAIVYLSDKLDDPSVSEASEALATAHRQISNLMRDAAPSTPRRLAVDGPLAALRVRVQEDYATAFENIRWEIQPGAEMAFCQLPEHASEVVYFATLELVRNAARHGRGKEEGRPLHLWIVATRDPELCLRIEDDGIGYQTDLDEARMGTSARGHGLGFHGTMLMAIGARLAVEANDKGGTCGQIVIPAEVLRQWVRASGQSHA
jgi:anti-sigma regulatory factor (Ser/Thr protein kinase)